jgi:membrane-associated protease RseP (regulator of RpoE activity)
LILLSEPARSPYDWQFFFLGFPVRVSWLFWLISAAWGYDWARGLHELYYRQQLETPGMFALLLIWIGICFVSILIHELGHAFAKRWYGISSYIVLYHFGGLSISDGADAWRRPARLRHWDQVIISAAGPVFQMAFGLLVAAIAIAMGLTLGTTSSLLSGWIPLPEGEAPSNAALMAIIDASVYMSIFWALLNLLPVLPLDGGRIAQGLIGQYQRNSGLQEATVLSIVVSALVALYGFRNDQPALGMFFAIFAILNVQTLQGNAPMR